MNDEQFLKSIMKDIEKYLIQNERPVIVIQGYEWFREVITLYAKQHNLLEAAILLMDNGMNEEAVIIARSAMNNYFLIGYLLEDDINRSRLKEYQIQPLISRKYLLRNMKDMLNGSFGQRIIRDGLQFPCSIEHLDNEINDIENKIVSAGLKKDIRPLSIRKLAEQSDINGFDFYATFYGEASKFEHSDISSLDIYKLPIDENTPANAAFVMDMNRTDENLKSKIYSMFIISYLDTFVKICEVICHKEPQLQINYDIKKISEMLIKVLAYIQK